jgi:hypothetical protein
VFVNEFLWPTQQHVTVSIVDTDVTLFEVGRHLEYSLHRKEKKEFTHRQRRKMRKYPITVKGKE